jgi:hypothetical protein
MLWARVNKRPKYAGLLEKIKLMKKKELHLMVWPD